MSLFSRKPAEPQKLGPQGFVPVPHEGRTIWVMPDFYKRDGIRMPVTGVTPCGSRRSGPALLACP
jgi:hypothetical protein